MGKIFLTVVNMSASATWLLLAVLLLRLALKKAPRAFTCALWALVGIRLAFPLSFESSFSFLPSAKVFPDTFLYAATPKIDSGFNVIDNALNPVIAGSFSPDPGASANPTQVYSFVFAFLWLFGIVAMLVYMAASFIRIKLRVREAVTAGEKVWLCDRIDTPFILGVIRPKIYISPNVNEKDISYVLAHEKAHIKRLDHIWKPLGFLLLALHWFNPAMWLAYVLFCRDTEFACDEKVIRELGAEEKKPYSEALLNLSVPHRAISACPLAFGEVGVKARIISVLGYKKPAFWLVLLSLALVLVTATGFLTSPYTEELPSERLSAFIDVQIHEHTKKDYNVHMFRIWEYEVMDIVEKEEETTVYMWIYYGEYSSDEENNAVCINLKKWPAAITAKKVNDYYELARYKAADSMESAKEYFPLYLHGRLNYFYKNVPPIVEKEIWNEFFNIAEKHFKTLKDYYVMDSLAFDINGDGKEEYLVLSPGPTSGMYTITLGVKEKGANSYSYNAIYYIYHGTGYFEFAVKNGNPCIKHTEATGKTNIFDMVYDGTDILLFENGEQLDMAKINPMNFHGVIFFS